MFEMLIKSAGGIDGIARLLAGAAGLTPEAAASHIDEIKELLHSLLRRVATCETDIAAIAAFVHEKENDHGDTTAP